MGIRREYEIEITRNQEGKIEPDRHHYEVEVWIEEDAEGFRIEVERIVRQVETRTRGQRLELPEPVRRDLERQVDRERGQIRRELDEAAHDAAVDAKISERKEGGR